MTKPVPIASADGKGFPIPISSLEAPPDFVPRILEADRSCQSGTQDPCDPWLLWQLADSAFPVGGFAHSGGLEAAWQSGEIASREELVGFLQASLTQWARGAVPFLAAVHAAPQRLKELDRYCDAFLSNHIANRASRLQGQSLLLACERIFDSAAIAELRRQLLQQDLPGHLAPTFGAVTRLLELSRGAAVRLFLFSLLRGAVTSAVRLGISGPLEAQAIQHRLGPSAEAAAILGLSLPLDDLAQTAPILDLLQGAQDRLYSRLFQS